MEYSLANSNKSKSYQTAEPSKYPQGYFKENLVGVVGKSLLQKLLVSSIVVKSVVRKLLNQDTLKEPTALQ